MRLGQLTLTNFGSYKCLEMNLADTGLALVFGPTGVGKSTIMDGVCWCLFGVTSKGGSVDEVKSWLTTSEPTAGTMEVEINDITILVTRIRGNPKQNDLFWVEPKSSGEKIRGKDLSDTQRLLSSRLGVSAALFLTSAYCSEYSESRAFFDSGASAGRRRRQLFEQIAPLDLPHRLADRCAEERRVCRDRLEPLESASAKQLGRIEQLRSSQADAVQASRRWEKEHQAAIKACQTQSEGFEVEKASKIQALFTKQDAWDAQNSIEIDKLASKAEKLRVKIACYEPETLDESTRCTECGSYPESFYKASASLKAAEVALQVDKGKLEDCLHVLERTVNAVNPFVAQIDAANRLVDAYAGAMRMHQAQVNPFNPDALKGTLTEAEGALKGTGEQIKALKHRVDLLGRLYDLSFVLRGELLAKAVSEVEAATNGYLDKYFEGELKVAFTLDQDDLEVGIQKSGYDCTYRQLSKGQRCLLKLSFSVAVQQAAANAAGVHFDNLFYDEAFDGLDEALKLKAYNLLESLAADHKSILLIDHSEQLRAMCDKKYEVTLSGDESSINEV